MNEIIIFIYISYSLFGGVLFIMASVHTELNINLRWIIVMGLLALLLWPFSLFMYLIWAFRWLFIEKLKIDQRLNNSFEKLANWIKAGN